jgi:hypothetical protein
VDTGHRTNYDLYTSQKQSTLRLRAGNHHIRGARELDIRQVSITIVTLRYDTKSHQVAKMNPLIVVHVADRVHHWYIRTLLCAFIHVVQHSGELVAKTRQCTTQQTLSHASRCCRTVQSCYAFDQPIISRSLLSLFIPRYLMPAARRRVPLLKECIAGTAAGSPRGTCHSELSSPTQLGPRFKWEHFECSHCHVCRPTLFVVQLTIPPIAYIRGASNFFQSQGFLASRTKFKILPAPSSRGLWSGRYSHEPP